VDTQKHADDGKCERGLACEETGGRAGEGRIPLISGREKKTGEDCLTRNGRRKKSRTLSILRVKKASCKDVGAIEDLRKRKAERERGGGGKIDAGKKRGGELKEFERGQRPWSAGATEKKDLLGRRLGVTKVDRRSGRGREKKR